MKQLIVILGLVFSTGAIAIETTVTVPWQEFDAIYKDQISQGFKDLEKPEPDPVITLENIQYDLEVKDSQVTGSVSIIGSVLVGDPEPVHLFGQNIAVTKILAAKNSVLLANNGDYALYTFEAGAFSIKFSVSIPITDFQAKPRLVFDVPPAVRNELKIKTSKDLKVLESDLLHKIGSSYFFSPRERLSVGFEHVGQPLTGSVSENTLLSEVDTPEAVLHSVTFFTSFAEDGTVLSAMHLVLPPNDSNRLELNPIDRGKSGRYR